MFFLLVFPTALFAQAISGDINENLEKSIEIVRNITKEETARSQDFVETVDMFVIDDVDVSPDEMYKITDDSRPLPQVAMRVYMGDNMLFQRNGYFADCIIPTFKTHDTYMGGWEYFIKANVPICKTEPKDKKYAPSYINGIRKGGENTTILQVSVKKNKKNGMSRDAFTREFEVDLNEGNVAAYKGAVFEIIEANNAEITYRVIRHFP